MEYLLYLQPWEDRMKTANEQGTLVLLQNLDPTYTSAEVEVLLILELWLFIYLFIVYMFLLDLILTSVLGFITPIQKSTF